MYVRKKSCYIGEANVCSESMEKCKQNIAGGRLGPLVTRLYIFIYISDSSLIILLNKFYQKF